MFRSLVVLLLIAYCAAFGPVSSKIISTGRKISMLAVGEVAPDFELPTFDGKKVKLSSFKVGSVFVSLLAVDPFRGCFSHPSSLIPL